MPFEIFQSEKTGKYHLRLKARNGQIVLSGEGYSAKAGAKNGIKSIMNNTANGDEMFDRLTSKNGAPYFVLKAKNGEPIGRSEMYSNKSAMEKGIRSVIKNAQLGEVKDLTS